MNFKLNLLTSQCDDLWILEEGVDVRGLQEIYDSLKEENADTACQSLIKWKRSSCYPNEVEIIVEVMGNEGAGVFDDTGQNLVLVVNWEKPIAVTKGFCILVTVPEIQVQECPEVKEVVDCESGLRVALLDCNNELVGYMKFETLLKCILEKITLCDLLEDSQRLSTPDADFDLIGVKDCEPYLINSMDMCCQPVERVEPSCE